MRDTIAAIATPPGAGGIGILRLSGPHAPAIAEAMAGILPPPRVAAYRALRSAAGEILDHGLVLRFAAPASYTGEDVCELHGHGSVAVLDLLLARALELGARAARPGEFTERAFRNGKLDLAQAEAVADLISARSARAARASRRSLDGEFSRALAALAGSVTDVRAQLEATLDFPDEVEPAAVAASIALPLREIRAGLDVLIAGARRGVRLANGARVAIVGAPNVGKSTLLNRLARADKAIVSPQPGTTRDVVETEVIVAGLSVRLADTAGLRETADDVETEGIARAGRALAEADVLLLVVDDDELHAPTETLAGLGQRPPPAVPTVVVHNKIDLRGGHPRRASVDGTAHVHLAAAAGLGLELLEAALADALGVADAGDHEFSARTRHVDALLRARAETAALDAALLVRAPEIAAEHLRLAQRALGEITGEVTTEELLGAIFARFCLGK